MSSITKDIKDFTWRDKEYFRIYQKELYKQKLGCKCMCENCKYYQLSATYDEVLVILIISCVKGSNQTLNDGTSETTQPSLM